MRVEHFSVYSAGQRVGSIEVADSGDLTEVESRIDTNGRGAKLREMIRLDSGHVPVQWTVEGTSLMGGTVDEQFTADGGTLSWRSQAEEGHLETGATRLYIPADTSKYAGLVYARAALAAGGEIQAVPSGTVRAEEFRRIEITAGTAVREVTIFVVTGTTITPRFVLLDSDGRLVAAAGGQLSLDEVLVRDDFADQVGVLGGLFAEFSLAYVADIQARVVHRYDEPFRIANVRIFDPGTLRLGDLMSVTVFRGRITSIQPQREVVAAGEVVIDGAGGTLLAGLHDMHAHVSEWSALFYLAAGVTAIRDMGNDNDKLLRLTERFDSGELAGPAVVPSGLIEGTSQYSLKLGVIPLTLAEALDAVRWYGDHGYHQIKIYNSMNPEWVRPLAAEAHRLGMRVAGHVPAFTTPDAMIEAGYDEITHINQLILGWLLDEGEDTRTPLRLTAMARARQLDLESERVRHTVGLMLGGRIGLDTTAVILERLMLSRGRTTIPADAPFLGHMPVSYQRQRRRTFVPYSSEEELGQYEDSFVMLLKVLRHLHDLGIPLWPGTDDGTGFTVHRELELYTAAGIPAAEVLRIATLDCARHIGLGHSHGSIERGKVASFILLDGDPVADISAVRRPRAVVKNGDVYFPSEIYAQLNITPFAAPPAVSGRPAQCLHREA
jgi:Amidohydrolase family